MRSGIQKNPYIIAEVGLSHEGSLGIAKNMVDKIAKCKVNAVKFQFHIAEEESTKNEKFRSKFSNQDKSRYDYWKRTSFKINEWKFLSEYSKKKGLDFICSPFSLKSVEILKKLKIDKWKIASGEVSNILILDKISKNYKQEITLSTGLTNRNELDAIMKFLKNKKNEISILQCTSEYPSKLNNINYSLINFFKKRYNVKSGISDHSGNLNSLKYAISIGADILEAHICYSKDFFGPDSSSSITFEELEELTKFKTDYLNMINFKNLSFTKLNQSQKIMRKLFNQNLIYKENFLQGHKISINDINHKKIHNGLSGLDVLKIINKKLNKKVYKNNLIKLSDFK